MCHSSVIIRKHIDLTITLEQHSPAPQSRYLSPGGTWSDEAGSELFLGLCFTPYAVFAPPLASLFFSPHLFLSSSLLSAHLMLHLPLPLSFLSPSLLPVHSAGGKGQAHLLPNLRLCRHGSSSRYDPLLSAVHRQALLDTHPCIPSCLRVKDASKGAFLQKR